MLPFLSNFKMQTKGTNTSHAHKQRAALFFPRQRPLRRKKLLQKPAGTRLAPREQLSAGLPGRKGRAQGAVPPGCAGPVPARCPSSRMRLCQRPCAPGDMAHPSNAVKAAVRLLPDRAHLPRIGRGFMKTRLSPTARKLDCYAQNWDTQQPLRSGRCTPFANHFQMLWL